ncbi:MAG: hypothetical protein E7462_00760 [Ruminococcaceae bacterium]|nr:hypothetical protein [Oscillospiraceae bacterium]
MLKNRVRLTKIISYVCVVLMLAVLVTQFLPFWSYSKELLVHDGQKHDQKLSMVVGGNSNPNNAGIYSAAVPVEAGKEYDLSMWTRCFDEEGYNIVGLRFYEDDVTVNETNHLSEQTGKSEGTKWFNIQLQAVAPENAKFARVWAWAKRIETEPKNHYFDEVSLTEAGKPEENLMAEHNYSFENMIGTTKQIMDWNLAEEAVQVSIASYFAFPKHSTGLSAKLLPLLPNETRQECVVNTIVTTVTLLLLTCVLGVIFILRKPGKAYLSFLPLAAGLIGVWQYLGNHLFREGQNWQIHLAVCILTAVVAAVNLVSLAIRPKAKVAE